MTHGVFGVTEDGILPHHRSAAEAWSLGQDAYDDISFALSDALAHAAQRLHAVPGEAILDVATGTGWSARNVARWGAKVTAVDIAEGLLAAAERLSAHVRPPIRFQLADAERLPFADGSFDGVISTFGVIFAHDQQQAAKELARVCRKGGRIALTTWAPDGSVAKFLDIIARHNDAPPPPASPLLWGEPDHVRALLGDGFALTFERGLNNAYYDDVQDVWDCYARGFGPINGLINRLTPRQLAAFKADIDAYHGSYTTEAGLHIKREYLLITGRRR